MDATDRTLVIILTVLLSIFIIVCIAVATGLYKLIQEARVVVAKTEEIVDTVESAAESIKRTSNSLQHI
jgi:CHASE3 domain sensor protein